MDLPLYRPVSPTPSDRIAFVPVTLVVALVLVVGVARGGASEIVDSAAARVGLDPMVVACVFGLLALGLVVLLGAGEQSLVSRLRRLRARRRYDRDAEGFENDLRDALERERRDLLRRADRRASVAGMPAVVVGRGDVESRVRVVGEPRRFVQHDLPLVVRPPGEIRVLGPPALASTVIDALVRQLRESAGPDVVTVEEGRIMPGRHVRVSVGGDGPRHDAWLIATATRAAPLTPGLTQLWFGPDGSALVRSWGRAGGEWVPVAPWLG